LGEVRVGVGVTVQSMDGVGVISGGVVPGSAAHAHGHGSLVDGKQTTLQLLVMTGTTQKVRMQAVTSRNDDEGET
jgi:hypothetical protein